ncbi:MAG: hypothetical protein ABIJ08_07285 [Nanoarchaeota archaeon]
MKELKRIKLKLKDFSFDDYVDMDSEAFKGKSKEEVWRLLDPTSQNLINTQMIIDAVCDRVDMFLTRIEKIKGLEGKVYCGFDHCTGLSNLPCDAKEHPGLKK